MTFSIAISYVKKNKDLHKKYIQVWGPRVFYIFLQSLYNKPYLHIYTKYSDPW